MSYEESVQQDYVMIANEHLESLSHRAQQILQRALGKQTLTEYAHCCASRITVPDRLTVREAMASKHAVQLKDAMQEDIDTLNKFHCFNFVPRSEALKHGCLVKSKWFSRQSLKRTAPFSAEKAVSSQKVSLNNMEPTSSRHFHPCFHIPVSGQFFRWLRRMTLL